MNKRQLVRKTLAAAILGIPFLLGAAIWAGGGLAAQGEPPEPVATRSSPIAITHSDDFVWSVNPDNDSVSVFQVADDENTKVAEITVGKEPWCVAITPDDAKAYVTNMASGTVSVISTVGKECDQDHQGRHRTLRMRADARWPEALRRQPILRHRLGDRHDARPGHPDDHERRRQATRHRDQC